MPHEQNAEQNLKRDISFFAAMALVVGMVIGSGIFMKPGKVLASAGDSTMALTAWTIGGIITLAAGLTIAELGAQIPKTGGLYAYLDEVYGRVCGYLFGWVQTLIYGPATTGALGLYFASLLIPFFGLPESYKIPLAVGSVMFLAVIHAVGTRYGGIIQSVATVAKLIPIVLIIVVGLVKGQGQILGMTSGIRETGGLGAAVLATLWAYDGWVGVGFIAGEMKNPAKELPRAIILGLGTVMAAYLLVNVAILYVLPAAVITALGNQAAGVVAAALFGDIGGKLISIGIIVSVFGALNGYLLTGPRVPLAMAIRGQLPGSAIIAKISPSLGTPINAIALQVMLSILMITVGDPDRLTDIAMFIIEIFYLLAFGAVFTLRRQQPAAQRPYSVPLYPLVPAAAILGALFIVISTLWNKPVDTMYALIVTAAGLPIYWLLNKRTGR